VELITAVVESFDESNHVADIRPTAHPAALWPSVPVSEHCPGELVAAGSTVSAIVWDDGTLTILGPVGSRPIWPRTYRDRYDTWQALSSTSYTARSNLSISVTHSVTSHYVITYQFTVQLSATASHLLNSRVFIDGGAEGSLLSSGGSSGLRIGQTIALRTQNALSPGTHIIDARHALVNAANTCSIGWSQMGVLVVPG